jgi:hypothetical protein
MINSKNDEKFWLSEFHQSQYPSLDFFEGEYPVRLMFVDRLSNIVDY